MAMLQTKLSRVVCSEPYLVSAIWLVWAPPHLCEPLIRVLLFSAPHFSELLLPITAATYLHSVTSLSRLLPKGGRRTDIVTSHNAHWAVGE